MFVAGHRQNHLGGGLPTTSLCRSYGAPGSHIAASRYKHSAPTELKPARIAYPEIVEKGKVISLKLLPLRTLRPPFLANFAFFSSV